MPRSFLSRGVRGVTGQLYWSFFGNDGRVTGELLLLLRSVQADVINVLVVHIVACAVGNELIIIFIIICSRGIHAKHAQPRDPPLG